MEKDGFKFVLRHSYNPEVYDILKDDKIIAVLKTQYGLIVVNRYDSDEVLFNLQLDDEFIGAIPYDMTDDIIDAIIEKLK